MFYAGNMTGDCAEIVAFHAKAQRDSFAEKNDGFAAIPAEEARKAYGRDGVNNKRTEKFKDGSTLETYSDKKTSKIIARVKRYPRDKNSLRSHRMKGKK
ncbi:MAG: hypothetical protein FWF77_03195 [Defluviitaleaceae bacterium]|nr:hypothetical protein [Defluviitaleaceae bacterium]